MSHAFNVRESCNAENPRQLYKPIFAEIEKSNKKMKIFKIKAAR
jgi:hypothetical protein